MKERVTRQQFDVWMAGYGEEMKKELWEQGTEIILRYVAQLEDEIAKRNGAVKLEGWDHV